ncbi:hypothetical protein C3L33_13601, partial [Rhododendron williamsianum]
MAGQTSQTFDAVDGKQARRTNSSSPLGELFDHGCDALACAFEALAFGNTAMCGGLTFWYWVISAVPFYLATWEHERKMDVVEFLLSSGSLGHMVLCYFTNTLILPAVNGPTEGLMLIYLVHFFTAIVGSEWWVQPFGKSLPFLSWIPVISVCRMSTRLSRRGKETCYWHWRWDYLSPEDIIRNYPHLVIIGTGLAFGFLVGRLILSHLCDEPKGLKTSMCMSLLFLPFGIANALTARLNDGYVFIFISMAMVLIYEARIGIVVQLYKDEHWHAVEVVSNCSLSTCESLCFSGRVPLVDERWVLLLYCAYTGEKFGFLPCNLNGTVDLPAHSCQLPLFGKSEAMDQIHGLSIVKILAEYGLHRFWILS